MEQSTIIQMPDEVIEGQGTEGIEGSEGGAPKVDETKYIPIDRFNEVYGKYKELERSSKAWEGLKPDEVRAKMDKLTQWEKAVEEAKKKSAMSDDEKSAADRAARVRKELLAIFPELAGLTKLSDFEKAIAELRGAQDEGVATEVIKEHSASLTALMKETGIDPKYQNKIENYLVALMSDEDKQAFLQGDFDVAKKLFEDDIKDGGLLASLVKKSAPIPPALRNPAGGTIVKGKAPKPMGLKEALDAGWERMKGGSE